MGYHRKPSVFGPWLRSFGQPAGVAVAIVPVCCQFMGLQIVAHHQLVAFAFGDTLVARQLVATCNCGLVVQGCGLAGFAVAVHLCFCLMLSPDLCV